MLNTEITQGLEPRPLFHWFEEISRVPRGSYHEEKIADYLVGFAAARGLDCVRDEMNNVLITLPATPGRESDPPILFQGHTDMVCEKNADCAHDFETQGIELYIDGDWIRARGTTLGGDDGIAVAAMLALLDGACPSHPRYECLFTVQEEVGLNGAGAFDYSLVTARRMINMDSEELHRVIAGCAGGLRSDVTLTPEWERPAGEMLRVDVSGLCGGHSGENINAGRANANTVLARILLSCMSAADYRLAAVNGGAKDNAIPREAWALVCTADAAAFTAAAEGEGRRIAAELGRDDRAFCLTVNPSAAAGQVMSSLWTHRAAALAACTPNGVLEMSRDVPGLVEFSRNLGVIRTENGQVCYTFSSRSAYDSQLDASAAQLDALAALCGGTVRHHSRYPGWTYTKTSPVRDAYCAAFKRVTGEDAEIAVIHAGLECGLIRAKIPDMDMISVGPDIVDIHSPGERLSISSCRTFWQILLEIVG